MSARIDDLETLSPVAAPSAGEFPPPGAPDIDIARAVAPRPILPLLQQRYGLPAESLVPYGHYKAKLVLPAAGGAASPARGKLVLVTAVTPTPAGEGKTTTSIGLCDALNRLGLSAAVCLREPSLGPCFGMKGGAAGGGRAQIIPMEDINLHFNGDFHAITAAHNLLAALLDNHLQWGNELGIDPRRVLWRRVVDLNDRALRNVTVGLGGPAHGVPRETGFDITVTSEIMAILCLAGDLTELERRIGDIIVARRRDLAPVTARELGAHGAMTVLLREALQPNVVQSLEHNPAFVHGGPFANIAHGCNSVAATRAALALNDIVVTEAGFGADLGAEKFLDIKCRQSGLRPDAAVLVCTVRALKYQGGVRKDRLAAPDRAALEKGAVNLRRHIRNLAAFGLSPVVAVNRFPSDSDDEIAALVAACRDSGCDAITAEHWARGGSGAVELAAAVVERCERGDADVTLLYPDRMPLADKIRRVATGIYGAADIVLSAPAARQLAEFEELGYGRLPVCIAKTPYSFSADPTLVGAPAGFELPVREVRLAAGAGFVVAVCGDIMTMPGLPRQPAALGIGLDARGRVVGLS